MCRAVQFMTKSWPSIRPGGGRVPGPKKYLNRDNTTLALRKLNRRARRVPSTRAPEEVHGGGKIYACGAGGASCGGCAAEALWRHGAGGLISDRGAGLPRS